MPGLCIYTDMCQTLYLSKTNTSAVRDQNVAIPLTYLSSNIFAQMLGPPPIETNVYVSRRSCWGLESTKVRGIQSRAGRRRGAIALAIFGLLSSMPKLARIVSW